MFPASAAPKQPHHAFSLSCVLPWGHSPKNFQLDSLFPAHLSPRAWLPPVSPSRAWHRRPWSPISGPLHMLFPPPGAHSPSL